MTHDYANLKKLVDRERCRSKRTILWRGVARALGSSSTEAAKLVWTRARDRERKEWKRREQLRGEQQNRTLAVPPEANFTPPTIAELDVLCPLFRFY